MHIELLQLGIPHTDDLINLINTVGIEFVHALYTEREQEIIVVQPIVRTYIGIHTGSRRLIGYRMQERRVAQVAMQGHEIKQLRSERRMSACAYAHQRQNYYSNTPFHRLFATIKRI